MLPIASHSRWISSPPLRPIAPATPPPSCRSLFAALTMASVSMSVRSPCWITIASASVLFMFSFTFFESCHRLRTLCDPRLSLAAAGCHGLFVAREGNFQAHAAANLAASRDGFLGSLAPFDQFQTPGSLSVREKAHPNASLGAKRDGSQIRDRKRSRRASKNRAGL